MSLMVQLSRRSIVFGVVLLFALLLTGGGAFSQQKKTVGFNNEPAEKVFNSLSKTFQVRFFYTGSTTAKAERISVPQQDRTLTEVLGFLETNYRFVFKRDGNMIAVDKQSAEPENGNGRSKEMRGRIGLNDGNAVVYASGVTVREKGTNNAAVSDENGYFSIKTTTAAPVLQVSYIGFLKKEVEAGTLNAFLSITLEKDARMLAEVSVVSTGYQTLSRKNTSGAYSTITSKEIERRSSQSLEAILEGSVPGLSVYNGFTGTNSARTQGTDIQLRGGSAVQSGRNTPLIIVDGFEVNRLPDNMNDIEKIDVLRDASAAAIWGSKAANGVIVITTKRGKDGKLQINYATNLYLTDRYDYDALHRASSKDMVAFDKEAYDKGFIDPMMYDGQASGYSSSYDILFQYNKGLISAEELQRKEDSLGSISNKQQVRNLLMREGFRQNHFLSLSGGNARYRFMFSSSFNESKSNFIGDKGRSVTLNTRNDYEIAPWFHVTGDIGVAFDNNDYGIDLRGALYTMAPYQLLKDNSGNYLYDYTSFNKDENDKLVTQGYYDWGKNLLQQALVNDNTAANFGLRTRLGIELKLAKGLTFRDDFVYDKTKTSGRTMLTPDNYSNRSFINQYTTLDATGKAVYNLPRGNILNTSDGNITNWDNRMQLNYTNLFAGKHYVNVLAGAELRKSVTDGYNTRKYGYDDDLLSWQPVLNPSALLGQTLTWWNGTRLPMYDQTNYDNFSYSDNRFMSVFSTASYTYSDKYTLTGSLRFDESNLFGADLKYRRTPLWSAGAAWNIDKESFFHSEVINTFKLRASYGLAGNVNTSSTPFLVASKTYQAAFNDYRARQVSYNPKLRWEKTSTLNIGADIALLRNRFQVTLDYYRKQGSDLLGTVVLDPTVGFTSAPINAASMTNQGIELAIQAAVINHSDFKWNSQFNFGYNQNKITSNKVADGSPQINRVTGTVQYVQGYARETLWSYNWAGLDNRGNPLVYDEKGGKIKVPVAGSLVNSGSYRPKYTGGFSNTFRYKGVFSNIFLVYNFGHVLRREMPTMNPYSSGNALNNQVSRRWMKPGDEATTDIAAIPTLDQQDFYDGRERVIQYSSNSVMPGGFVRLREVQLGYELPAGWLHRTPFRSISLVAQMNNVAFWAQNKYHVDPEAVDPVSGYYYLPAPRTQAITLKVGL